MGHKWHAIPVLNITEEDRGRIQISKVVFL